MRCRPEKTKTAFAGKSEDGFLFFLSVNLNCLYRDGRTIT